MADEANIPATTTPAAVPAKAPEAARVQSVGITRVERTDLRNRVWTGFLMGIGFWLGSIVGVTLFSIFVGIVAGVLSLFGVAALGTMGSM